MCSWSSILTASWMKNWMFPWGLHDVWGHSMTHPSTRFISFGPLKIVQPVNHPTFAKKKSPNPSCFGQKTPHVTNLSVFQKSQKNCPPLNPPQNIPHRSPALQHLPRKLLEGIQRCKSGGSARTGRTRPAKSWDFPLRNPAGLFAFFPRKETKWKQKGGA